MTISTSAAPEAAINPFDELVLDCQNSPVEYQLPQLSTTTAYPHMRIKSKPDTKPIGQTETPNPGRSSFMRDFQAGILTKF